MLIVLIPIVALARGVSKLFSKLALESPDERLAYWVLLGGVFTFYLLWVGLPMLMGTRRDLALAFAALITACVLAPAVVLAML